MKGLSLKRALILLIPILSLVLLLPTQGWAEMREAKEAMAKWRKGEARWRRASFKKWTPSELKRLRDEAIRSQPASPEDRVITIRKGDTIWDLANQYLGNPWLWPRLWAYDGNLYIENPHEITPGKRIVIPSESPRVVKEDVVEDVARVSELRKEIEVLRKVKNEREERIAQLNQELIALRAKDIERERIKRELEGKLEDALTDRKIYEMTVVAKKEAEIARLSREVEELKEQIYFLENELAQKEAEIRQKEEMIKAHEVTIGHQIGQINRLSTQLDEERKELEQFFAFAGVIGGIIALSLSH